MSPCKVDGCEQPGAAARGLCWKHYARVQRNGTTETVRTARPPCSLPDCDKPHCALGYCTNHYRRYKKHGDPMKGRRTHTITPKGEPRIDPAGYVFINGQLEHRTVMSEMIGRPLRDNESVHHINGIRHDNRPVNLELWTRSQPYGQRVMDLVEWVVREYPDEVRRILDAPADEQQEPIPTITSRFPFDLTG
jgi:hypothetical protein